MGFVELVRDVVRRRGRQAGQAVPVALTFVVAGSPLALALLLGDERDESCFVLGGLVVQLAGFFTVWSQITTALAAHGRPGPWGRLRKWLRSGSRQQVTVSAGTAMSSATAFDARSQQRLGKGDHSHHARLLALERNFENLERELHALEEQHDKEAAALRGLISKEGKKRTSDVGDLRKQLEDTAVGSANRQLAGLLWFVTGSISSTTAVHLAEWF